MAVLAGCVGDDDSFGDDGDDGDDGDGGDDEDEGTALRSYIPHGTQSIAQLNGSVQTDEETRTILDTFYQLDGRDGFSEVETQLEDNTGLDPGGLDVAVLYSADLENANQELGGVLLDADWAVEDLVELVEEEASTTYEAQDYAGEPDVLYLPAESTGQTESVSLLNRVQSRTISYLGHQATDNESLALAELDNGAYVVGSESAVVGALDVAYDDSDAIDGAVLSAFETAHGEGYATLATVIPTEEIPEEPPEGEDFEMAPFQQATLATMTYYTDDGSLGLTGRVVFEDESAAEAAVESAEGIRELVEEEQIASVYLMPLAGAEFEQDGSALVATNEKMTDEVAEDIESLQSSNTPSPQPTATFDTEYSGGAFTITHAGGDTLEPDSVEIRTSRGTYTWLDVADEPVDSVRAGDQVALEEGTEFEQGDTIDVAIVTPNTTTVVVTTTAS